MDSIINNIDRNLFITYFASPLILCNRIVVISPPLAEHEGGFETWLRKIALLSNELSIPVVLIGNTETHKAILAFMEINRIRILIDFKLFEDWDSFPSVPVTINDSDLLILLLARKGSVSYIHSLDIMPYKFEKIFERNSRILIYPHQHIQNSNYVNKIEDLL